MSEILALIRILVLPILASGVLVGADWPAWRGTHGDGVSDETGIISHWSKEGTNLAWKVEFQGRSTPIVLGRRVCANGRIGEGIDRQEMVACYDAGSGKKLWDNRFNVYLTTVPWNRVGWANISGDPETGYIYVQGVGGLFLCLDENGVVIWSRSLVQDYGFFSGYGGRTQTPLVDEGLVIVTFVSSSWGEWAAPRHRTFAFDKLSGELLWVATPGGTFPPDLNTQSTPAVATIEGQRLLIQGNADGRIYAIQARTGKSVWSFRLSKRGLNTSPLVVGETVFASHSEENPSGGPMGAVVAIKATGRGDVTDTHEKWRAQISAGFSSPLYREGRLYIVDNSANLHCLDSSNGQHLWDFNLGTVGKGSPVWADGKIFVSEVNGRFHILGLSTTGATSLDEEKLTTPEGRYAEIYGAPAIAHGRIFLTTESGLYALGDPSVFQLQKTDKIIMSEPGKGQIAMIRAVPAEVKMQPDKARRFRVLAYDSLGRNLGEKDARWRLVGLRGRVGQDGEYSPAGNKSFQVGTLEAKVGSLTAVSRVRVFGAPELEEDFQAIEIGRRPDYLLGALVNFKVAQDEEGNKYLVKSPSARSIHRHRTFLGPDHWEDYTIQADLRATRSRRKVPDMGLINSGYTLDLMGVYQKIQVRSWTAERRMAREVPFKWEADRWYLMKFRVDVDEGKAIIKGKVWPRDEVEPSEWTITAEDPHPILAGSPGLIAYSPTPVYFDNIRVIQNRK